MLSCNIQKLTFPFCFWNSRAHCPMLVLTCWSSTIQGGDYFLYYFYCKSVCSEHWARLASWSLHHFLMRKARECPLNLVGTDWGIRETRCFEVLCLTACSSGSGSERGAVVLSCVNCLRHLTYTFWIWRCHLLLQGSWAPWFGLQNPFFQFRYSLNMFEISDVCLKCLRTIITCLHFLKILLF